MSRLPRTVSAPSHRLPDPSPPLWAAVAVFALLLSACEVRQEIRFNPDGTGTASVTVAIDTTCELPDNECSERAQRLLRGKGPVANARADAEGLPFDVRIEPFERGFVPPDNQPQTGYTLSFDFASLKDLEQKLAPGPATDTSSLELSGMTFEPNGEGGHTFMVEVSPAAHLGWGSAEQGAPDLRLTVVVPGTGTGEHSADITDEVDGGIRFVWTFEAIEEGEESWPAQLNASTCSRDACPRSAMPILIVLIVVEAGVVTAAVVVFVTISRKRGGGDVTS